MPSELNRLIQDVFLAPESRMEHISDFDAVCENDRLDKDDERPRPFAAADGWREASVKIQLEAHSIYHRLLLDVIKAACCGSPSKVFHWIPFKLFHHPKPRTGPSVPPPPEWLYGDAYTADALLAENGKIQMKAREDREPGDGPEMEYVPVPLMFAPDSTHSTNFGSASLWPIYLCLSKYMRVCPTSFSAHHLTYIPPLLPNIQSAYEAAYREPASAAMLRFCKCELMQAIWLLLLDDESVKAYIHGVFIGCGDGIVRRIFPRTLTYAADYPEKCLLTCTKFLARCPCTDCRVSKDKVYLMGSKSGMQTRATQRQKDNEHLRHNIVTARRNIFQFGTPPGGILGAASSTPIRSTFSTCLAQFVFDIYYMPMLDLLQEFELGVWKATAIHLVQILFAARGRCVQEMDSHYSKVPTFGRNTNHRFGANDTDFKKLVACDYEDLLQCATPIFEGLLSPHSDAIITAACTALVAGMFRDFFRTLRASTSLLYFEQQYLL
ncbi:hypothetical protein GY45DRAFT_1357050 [Cubamyces sp. BRFM 1775]|nr:hypothetical protein GY45DRAFT_1357050 [Cubamyces sp. BRFM 1775]